MMLPVEIMEVFDPPYNTRGTQRPIINNTILENKTNETIFRVTVDTSDEGTRSYRGKGKYFTVWNGQPDYFDLND